MDNDKFNLFYSKNSFVPSNLDNPTNEPIFVFYSSSVTMYGLACIKQNILQKLIFTQLGVESYPSTLVGKCFNLLGVFMFLFNDFLTKTRVSFIKMSKSKGCSHFLLVIRSWHNNVVWFSIVQTFFLFFL